MSPVRQTFRFRHAAAKVSAAERDGSEVTDADGDKAEHDRAKRVASRGREISVSRKIESLQAER
jgi:hypothetical protein